MAISQEISYRLERLILDGGLAPGQKIPSERQLAARLRVSRAIIREALHELQGRGVIETRHGKGSFVASLVPETGEFELDTNGDPVVGTGGLLLRWSEIEYLEFIDA